MHNIFKSTGALFLGKISIAALGFLSTSLITRYLGDLEYGQYSYIFSLTATYFILADFGLSIQIIRNVAKNEASHVLEKAMLTRTFLAMISCVALCMYLLYTRVSFQFFVVSGIFMLYQWLLYVSLSFEAYLQGKQNFGKAVLPQVVAALVGVLATFTAVKSDLGLIGLASVLLLSQFSAVLVGQYLNRVKVSSLFYSLSDIFALLQKVSPLALGVMLSMLYFKIDIVIMGAFFSPQQSNDVGLYAIAYKWFETGLVFSGYIIQVLFPTFAAINDINRLKIEVIRYFFIVLLIALFISGTIFLFAPSLVLLLGGSDFIKADIILRILSLALVPTLLGGFLMSIILSLKKDLMYVAISLTALVLNIVLNVFFIPHYSYLAAAWVTVITQIWVFVGYTVCVYIFLFKKKASQKTEKFDQHFYETFHEVVKTPKKIVNEDDYTHGPLVKLIRPIVKKGNLNILDIGCGTGSLSVYLAHMKNQVLGIDISERAIAGSRQYAKKVNVDKNATFVVGVLEDLDRSKKFDCVFAIEVIEHVDNDEKFLEEIAKRIKTNGKLILSTPSRNAPLFRIGFLNGFEKRVGHLRRYLSQEIESLLRKSGFEVIKTYETEGVVRNAMYTSTIGTKLLLRIINRSAIAKHLFMLLDTISIRFFGTSDIIIIAKKR